MESSKRREKTKFGDVIFEDNNVHVYPDPHISAEVHFDYLQPLVELKDIQEIYISETEGQQRIRATIGNKDYTVKLQGKLDVNRLAERIAIEAGIILNDINPQGVGEYYGWRVYLSMPLISGGWEIVLTRLPSLENITVDPLLTARLVTLLASPMSAIILGPPNSGKTTLLLHLVDTFTRLFPRAKISIVEEVPEIARHIKAPNIRKYFSRQQQATNAKRSIADYIRKTMEYDRPDILVVGELYGEEALSALEIAYWGTPVLTTLRGTGLKDALKRLNKIIESKGMETRIVDIIPLYISTDIVVSSGGRRRSINGVYLHKEGSVFNIVYESGQFLDEDNFLNLLPPTLRFTFDYEEKDKTYELIKNNLGVNTKNHYTKALVNIPPLTLNDL
jgi:type IV secretory pathway ATPase VirB11/archaellum biosynthesis ATPase